MTQKILPPFGKILLAYQKESIRLEFPLYIFVGKNSKEEAITHQQMGVMATYLPYGDAYQKYDWPIGDQTVVVVDTGCTVSLWLKKMKYYLGKNYQVKNIFILPEVQHTDLIANGECSNGR